MKRVYISRYPVSAFNRVSRYASRVTIFMLLLALCAALSALTAVPARAATSIVMADEGIELILGRFFNDDASQNLQLKLYCNNYTPVRTMTTASFTECTGGGYAAKTLLNGSWTIEANTPRDALYATQTFTFTGPLTTNTTVYGYYVTNAAADKVIWAQSLNAAFTPANNGDNIAINPTRLKMSGGTPN